MFLGGIMATYFHHHKAGIRSLCMLLMLGDKALCGLRRTHGRGGISALIRPFEAHGY